MKYGTAKYGTFKYGAVVIGPSVFSTGILSVGMQWLGQPVIADAYATGRFAIAAALGSGIPEFRSAFTGEPELRSAFQIGEVTIGER